MAKLIINIRSPSLNEFGVSYFARQCQDVFMLSELHVLFLYY